MGVGDGSTNERAQAIEQRLDVPVLVAALVSVPAVFLTMTDGVLAVLGNVLNVVSGVVLVGESVLLLLLSREKLAWIREHRSELLLAVATIPAVVLLVGPVQVFRLLIFVSALRMLRVRRILGAADVISRRTNLGPRRHRAVLWVVTVIAVVFVGVVLADPTSASRRAVDWIVAHVGLVPAAVAAVLVVGTVLVAWRVQLVSRLVRRFRSAGSVQKDNGKGPHDEG
ncbi:hypothetical protein [Actinophytocola gossypii]|uniref:Ion transporter n=1 Tax=Actinophytocola gossypii TaxID=2812003 RepID=A0ABT2JBZ4_9PSEU|nr:hypothetical protein [Actinophytocola gossypii]MCT2585383.1 hypothetical protein [Actinophytocola gossypii]